jgi:four helix bundle protein
MAKFRFEDLEIWKMAIQISIKLFDIADKLEYQKLFKFAEQLRAAGLSLTNNIAEGSGSFTNLDFSNFLKFSRRSVFECANMVYIFNVRNLISEDEKKQLWNDLEVLSRSIVNFKKTLLRS